MKLRDYGKLGWDQLRRRKVVTALCVMGIAIGSASIVVALAFGESLAHYSEKQMGYYLKTDEITITGDGAVSRDEQQAAGGPASADGITKAKIDLIRTFPHVKAVAGFLDLGDADFVVDGDKKGRVQLVATDLEALPAFGKEFAQGGADAAGGSVILNYGAALGVFDAKTQQVRERQLQQSGSDPAVRERIQQLDNLPYPVYRKTIVLEIGAGVPGASDPGTGASAPAGGAGSSGQVELAVRVGGVLKRPDGTPDYMTWNNKQAYLSFALAERLLELRKAAMAGRDAGLPSVDRPNRVVIKVDSTDHVAEVDSLVRKLRLNTQNNLHQKDRMNEEFVIVRLIFGGAGLFILFVASISIVVAMTMSTYQRRRQIGIMKVLGANLRQIRNLFIVESALLGVIGGACGIVLSYWVVWGINGIVYRFSKGPPGMDPQLLFISPWILPVGLFFAVLTGGLSGIYPAVKASRTDALTAIKRE
jgi:ABC-type lipoprotein release transport system permease subunit